MGQGPGRPPRRQRRQRPHGRDRELLAWLARAGPASRPPLAGPDPALRPGHQGPHLHAHRSDGGRAHHLAARDPRRGAQLGLPLHLDAGHHLHPAGAALAQPGLGSRRVHGVRRRPGAQRGRRAADHVRDRRTPGPDRVDPRRPLRLRRRPSRTHRQRRLRPAPERRVRGRARLGPAPHPPQPASAPAAVAAGRVPGQLRHGCLARARPGHLGGPRQAPALCVVQADVLGGARPRGQAGRDPWRPRPAGGLGWGGRGDPRRHPRARGQRARGAAPALRDRRPGRLHAAGRPVRVPSRPRRAAAQVRPGRRRRAERERLRAALSHRRDRRRPEREGGDVPDLLVLAGVGPGHRRGGAARPRPDGAAAAHRLPAGAVRRGVRRRHRPPPGQLPPGVLAPGTDRGGRADHRGRTAGGDLMSAYDVIIVGTGAGGGTLVRHLAASGKRILLLERGGWLAREPQNWSAADVFIDNRYISPDRWYDDKGKAFQPQIHYFVGGATKLYGAALYRLRREDFGELKHHDGVSPAWPIGYDDMEPYYTKAEQLYQVHGNRGEDPTEPPASAPYPFPAVSPEPRIQQLSDDLAAAGRHPFHAPCGVMVDEANPPFSRCIRNATCDGFPCLLHAKPDAEVLGVRPALEHPNVTLVTGARAVKLVTNDAGTVVTGVEVDHDGTREVFTGDLVVVACGAANSAKLVLALSKEPNPTVFQKTLGVNDFYFGGPDFDFPMGNIQMIGKSQADMFKGEKPLETKLAPGFALRDVAGHAVDFWLSTEDLPTPENRVTLERDGNIKLSYTASNHTAAARLYHQLKSMLGHLGMHPDHLIPRHAYLKTDIPVAGVAHQAGTCRMGADPATSVLNVDCRAHELDNLYVVDTSCFPSIGAVNPALTAMANALRVGDHLLERLGAR